MAGGTDFLVDLETALQLLLVELAEHAVAGKTQRLAMFVESVFHGFRGRSVIAV